MLAGSYKIRIVHYYNPHLLWIEGVNSSSHNTYEQIGVYGVLPLTVNLDLDCEKGEITLTQAKCLEWVPAATNLMKEFLRDAKETWFCPIYISHMSTIFDDNIHKYGELIIKSSNGEIKKLSEFLISSSFALHNPTKFFTILSSGNLKTKLDVSQVCDVLKHLYANCREDKEKIRAITTVATKIVSLEQELMDLNFDRYENNFLDILNNKINTLKLCKDVDEESEGRANKRIRNDKDIIENVEKQGTPYTLKKYFENRMIFKNSESTSNHDDSNTSQNHEDVSQIKHEIKNVNMSKKLDLLKRLADKKKTLSLDSIDVSMLGPRENGIRNKQNKETVNGDKFKDALKKINEDNICDTNIPAVVKDIERDKENGNSVQETDKLSQMNTKLLLLKSKAKKSSKVDIPKENDKYSNDEYNDVIKQINMAYPNTKHHVVKNKLQEIIEKSKKPTIDNRISSERCDFIDKIVTPVVLVHSKFKKAIRPIYSLKDIPFNNHIRITLKNMMISQAMAIQSISWHTILRGHSLFMIGPKHSGKTMGYLPSVSRLVTDGTPEILNSVGPICIIVCATAESVTEVESIAKKLLGLKEKVLACYAGVDDIFITTSLLNSCDLLISTPPVLVRLLQDQDFGVDLRRVRTLVLDDCERLSEVYKTEIKFFHHKIRELEKSRANKELRVQYIVASRVWCDFMGPLAKKVPDTVISISSFPECILYSKANMSVSFLEKTNKIASVIEFLNEIDTSKKTVIVCRFNDEVDLLHKELKHLKNYVFTCDNDTSVCDLYNLKGDWSDYNVPLLGPILICTDDNLSHLNITDAHNLVQYSLPKSYSYFKKRFSVLNDNYPSIFNSERECVKIKILLDDVNTEKLPKIVSFLKRCTDIPKYIDEMSEKILLAKDVVMAKNLVPICDGILSLGYCPEFYDCLNRHRILKGFDEPPEWVPKSGIVTFTILHYHSATNYSVRLLSHIENGKETKFPSAYISLCVKLGMFFGKASNRKLHGAPKVGDICAVMINQDLFARCQIIKILSVCQKGNPKYVLIKLLDEEKYERVRNIYLYHLPKEFSTVDTHVAQIRLANVQPKDKDITFSALACKHLESLTNEEADLYVRGRIAGVIGKCIYVDTLEACRELSSLDEIVVQYDLKYELLEKHAEANPDHIRTLKELCAESDYIMVAEVLPRPIQKIKTKNSGSWAHMEIDNLAGVHLTSILDPDQCFIRLNEFEPCVQILLKDIEKYIETNPEPLEDIEIGDIVLAKFPDDETYERARVDAIDNTLVKCFFVDQGDWVYIPKKNVVPITDKLINQLPFQCIECRLVGIKPPGASWTDFSINWLSTQADEGAKFLYAKYFKKEPAKFTGGNKYSIALIDTNSASDIIINQLMIDLNLAQGDDEIDYLNYVIPKNQFGEIETNEEIDSGVSDNENEESNPNNDSPSAPLSQIFLPQPKRSVPLVASDSESESADQWDFQNPTAFMKLLKIAQQPNEKPANETHPSKAKLLAIAPDPQSDTNSVKNQVFSNTKSSPKTSDDAQNSNNEESNLDSDDIESLSMELCSPLIKDDTRKPKLTWRQNKTSVCIKIQLIGVKHYDLSIGDRRIEFSTNVHDTNYKFSFDLYAVVDKDVSSHTNKGQCIVVKLAKVLHKNWLTLTKDPELKKWIIYDVDGIDASSDEELVDDTLMKMAKVIHGKQDTDSDEDDIIDDIAYRYE